MPNPTVNDVQAVSPVLTNMLVGYLQADTRFVADRVFPGVPVDKKAGTYYVFTQKYWFADEMHPRSPGAPFAEGDFGVETDTYTALQYALQKGIADEERANSQLPMDLEQTAVKWLAQQILIKKERQFATDFMAASVWGTTDNDSATDWDDYESGDPAANIATGRETISGNTGQDPNTLVMGLVVWDALKLHPDILDRIKYTTAATAQNVAAAVGGVLEIPNILVSRASYNTANEAQTASYSAIIDDDALLCYTEPGAGGMGATA